MKDTEGMLVLLQDIKEMLWGLSLLLVGIALCAMGLAGILWGLPLLIGTIVCVAGLAYTHHGFTHHEVIENKDEK